MKALLTGSYAYGRPNDESDVDIVLLVSASEYDAIHKLADTFKESLDSKARPTSYAHRFGKLNLILCDEERYLQWESATADLVERAPVTREQAIEVMKRHRGTCESEAGNK